MGRGMRVMIDADALVHDVNGLESRLRSGGKHEAQNQAFITAGKIGAATPYRTGALFNTIATVAAGEDSWGVTWGGDLPYAFYVNKRKRPVQKGMRGCRTQFKRALQELADRETRRV